MKTCVYYSTCAAAGDPIHCNSMCWHFQAYRTYLKRAHVPSAVRNALSDTGLSDIKQATRTLIQDRMTHFKLGKNYLLYSVGTTENTLGTGTGKTTTAVYLLDHALQCIVARHEPITALPCYFISASELQNKFNSQFRTNTDEYQKLKKTLIQTYVLVLDDIATREVTPSYLNELYEIINARWANGLTTIYTSNHDLDYIEKVLGERIASRISDSEKIVFFGADLRRKEDFDL